MIRPRIGCYSIYEPAEEGWENWESQSARVQQAIAGQGLEVVAAPEAVKDLESMERVAAYFKAERVDLLHALIITWSFDHYTIEIQQRLGVPLVIRAIPGIRTGSIVGSQQLSSVLSDLDVTHRLFYGGMDEAEPAEQTAVFARACAIRSRLRGARLGVIGRRTEGMTPTAVDEVEILRVFGIRLIHYGLDELQDIAAAVGEDEAAAVWERIRSGARQVLSKTEHGLNTARNYLACRKIIQQHALNALTIGSYPKCQGTMCVPISWLNQEGLPTGCEGDVNATIALLMLSFLSDEPGHFGEMLEIDAASNTLVTSHCGCGSPGLANEEGYSLMPVRLANDGVCIRFAAKPGPISYVNLVGRKHNYRLCCLEGDGVPTGMVFEGNPLKFVLKTPVHQVWQVLAQHHFGHHWMSGYVHAARELAELCRLRGIRGVFPDSGVVV